MSALIPVAENVGGSPKITDNSTESDASVDNFNQNQTTWLTDKSSESVKTSLKIKNIIHQSTSKVQRIQVVETVAFGKTLLLDGVAQSSQLDEFIYHECLVHPALILHGNPKSVFVGGGGELATAREVLKYSCVERLVMCDLDEEVVMVSNETLPEWGAGCLEDSRLNIRFQDAYDCLTQNEETYDVIYMDICDPIEAGPGTILYTSEFYRFVQNKLNDGGIFVTQSGSSCLTCSQECFTAIHKTLQQHFPQVAPYTAYIPSFGTRWGFNLAFCSLSMADDAKDIVNISPRNIDEQIAGKVLGELKFYDGVAHLGLFGIPKYLRKLLREEQRIISKENPIFMHAESSIEQDDAPWK